jgi:hypothetical protein
MIGLLQQFNTLASLLCARAIMLLLLQVLPPLRCGCALTLACRGLLRCMSWLRLGSWLSSAGRPMRRKSEQYYNK